MNMNISRFSPCVFTQPSQLCTSGNYSDQASNMQLHYSESESLTTVWNASFQPAVFTETIGSALAKALFKDIGLKLNRPSNECIKTEIETNDISQISQRFKIKTAHHIWLRQLRENCTPHRTEAKRFQVHSNQGTPTVFRVRVEKWICFDPLLTSPCSHISLDEIGWYWVSQYYWRWYCWANKGTNKL